MGRASLLPAVRGLHFALVQLASLGLGGFFWFTLMMMTWRTLPPADAGGHAALVAAAPYLAALAVHFVTLWYLGQTSYVMQIRTVIAVLSGSLLTYLLMSLFQAEYAVVKPELAGRHLQGLATTVLFFLPGWALVQWLRPRLERDPAKEAIRVPVTLACFSGAGTGAAVYLLSNSTPIAAVALLGALCGVFVTVHWIYHGRIGFREDGTERAIRS